MSDPIVKAKLAFDGDTDGYHFAAWYLTSPKGDALVEITKDGETVRSFLWPAYKVWNVAAHAHDIVADIEQGLSFAGSDGLGGGCVARDVPS